VSVVAITADDAQKRNAYTADQTKPKLESTAYNVNDGVLTLVFDESIRHLKVLPGSVTLKESLVSPAVSVITDRATVAQENGKTIKLTLHPDEQNEVKRQKTLCISKESCIVILAAGGAGDMAQPANLNDLKSPNTASVSWTKDSTAPKITEFSYSLGGGDGGGGVVTLKLDETVSAATLNQSKIWLQNQKSATVELSHQIDTIEKLDQLVDGTTFKLELSANDVAAIKTKGFCTKKENCFARFELGVFADMSADAHKTEAITNAGAKQATAVAEDETNPSLQKFAAVDYNTGTIKLEFKEPVDWDTLDVSKLMLSSWYEVDDATTMTLTNVDVDANNDWGFGVGYTHPQVPHEITSVLIITMTPADLDKLKGEETFCKNSNGNDCYVAIKPGFIKDVSGNAIDEAELDPNRKAESVSLDTSGPTLKKAGLSMQAGTLELSFDEPVVATSIQLQELKFISNADPNTDGIKSLKMSAFGATDLLETNVEDRSNKNKFTITLPPLQLNKLKAADGLCTKTSDCFVLLEAAFIKDIASGANANREMTAGQGLSSFARDTTAPAFTQFYFVRPKHGYVLDQIQRSNRQGLGCVGWDNVPSDGCRTSLYHVETAAVERRKQRLCRR
jgi:hypothetical protein